ncbi:hypothetical protein Q5794_05990 [Priestia megaterium]|uniref:hypothetical protein n=1 Tax=Priestia megaterium TaxID=1404 RepID=UPI0035BE9F48
MKTERELHLLGHIIEKSNYPAEKLQKGIDLKFILEHACTVNCITGDEKLKLQAVFQ